MEIDCFFSSKGVLWKLSQIKNVYKIVRCRDLFRWWNVELGLKKLDFVCLAGRFTTLF